MFNNVPMTLTLKKGLQYVCPIAVHSFDLFINDIIIIMNEV